MLQIYAFLGEIEEGKARFGDDEEKLSSHEQIQPENGKAAGDPGEANQSSNVCHDQSQKRHRLSQRTLLEGWSL